MVAGRPNLRSRKRCPAYPSNTLSKRQISGACVLPVHFKTPTISEGQGSSRLLFMLDANTVLIIEYRLGETRWKDMKYLANLKTQWKGKAVFTPMSSA